MNTHVWAMATAISAARSLDECTKAFLKDGDTANAQICAVAAKAAHKAAESLREGK